MQGKDGASGGNGSEICMQERSGRKEREGKEGHARKEGRKEGRKAGG